MGAKFKGKACRCPFHEESNPSAGIFEKNGHWFFKCHGCGVAHDIFSVLAVVNKTTVAQELQKVGANEFLRNCEPAQRIYGTIKDVETDIARWQDCERIENVFTYTHPTSGRVELAVVRWWHRQQQKKKFTQVSPTPGGFWLKGVIGQNPIYNRKRVAEADTVVVVEGEKCVHALHDIGIIATTSPAGAMNGDKADWTPLAGKTCILWPDADEPTDEFPNGKGVEHMRQVQKILATLSPPARLAMVNIAQLDMKPGGDAADLIARYRKGFSVAETKALIDEVLADADPVGIMGEFLKEIEAIMAGQRRVIPFPWGQVTASSRALMPGKVTCICGDGGAGKSLWVGQCLVDWCDMIDAKACIYHLEDDRNYHMFRALAQMSGEARVTDPDWVLGNQPAMNDIVKLYAQKLEKVGARIFEAPDDQVSLAMLTKWVEDRAKEGFEIICIDPVTATEAAARPWIEDLKFITRCKVICRRYGCRVIFVTHPRTGAKQGKANHNDMAGGAAYPRFAHTVFWLERNDAEASYKVYDGQMTTFRQPNRVLLIAKARNGPGAGRRIALQFEPATLNYVELGLILRESES